MVFRVIGLGFGGIPVTCRQPHGQVSIGAGSQQGATSPPCSAGFPGKVGGSAGADSPVGSIEQLLGHGGWVVSEQAGKEGGVAPPPRPQAWQPLLNSVSDAAVARGDESIECKVRGDRR
jgi:hypothetical protein